MVYYSHCREDILECVPADAVSVLSVGCGAGVTESELVSRGIKVVGIELNPDAAEAARQGGLTVLNGDALSVDLSGNEDLFDCLIYADVLEHLIDPVAVLQQHLKFLKDDGVVIISVPNFRHFSVFKQLFVSGCINYVDSGILDRTHIRLTTRKMVLSWFELMGLKSQKCNFLLGPKRKVFSFFTAGILKDFLAKQVVLVGKKSKGQMDKF